jgi:Protein of unknown function (DUF2796)
MSVTSRAVGLLLLVGLASAWARAPHEHGVARLDVAVEPGRILVELQSPLNNFVGFERAPRNEAETAKAEAAIKKLRNGAEMFRIDGNAGCTLDKVVLTAPQLGLSAPVPTAASDHADLQGSFEFKCSAGSKASFMEVGLFDAFSGFKRIDLQVITPRGQLKASLRRPASRVVLAR